MLLVIDIDGKTYENTCNESMLPPDVTDVVKGIKNGTPLKEYCNGCIYYPTETEDD